MSKFNCGFQIHLSGMFNAASYMGRWTKDKKESGLYVHSDRGTFFGSEYRGVSILTLDSGYRLVFIDTNLLQTVLLVDEYGYGSHACSTSAYDSVDMAIICDKEEVANKAIPLKDYILENDDDVIFEIIAEELEKMLKDIFIDPKNYEVYNKIVEKI